MARANKEDDRTYGRQYYKDLKNRAESNDNFKKQAIFYIIISIILSLASLWLSYGNYVRINEYFGP